MDDGGAVVAAADDDDDDDFAAAGATTCVCCVPVLGLRGVGAIASAGMPGIPKEDDTRSGGGG